MLGIKRNKIRLLNIVGVINLGLFTDFIWVVHGTVSTSEIPANYFIVSRIGPIAPLPLPLDHFGPNCDTIKSTVAARGIEIKSKPFFYAGDSFLSHHHLKSVNSGSYIYNNITNPLFSDESTAWLLRDGRGKVLVRHRGRDHDQHRQRRVLRGH